MLKLDIKDLEIQRLLEENQMLREKVSELENELEAYRNILKSFVTFSSFVSSKLKKYKK